MILNLASKDIRGRHVDVAGNDRERYAVRQFGQTFVTIVEFVVTNGHRIETDLFHELDFHVTFVGRVHQRALILVTGIQNDHVFTGQLFAKLVDHGRNARNTAKAFASIVVFGAAGAVVFADRFNARVQVVDVDDVQRIICHRGAGRQRQRTCGKKNTVNHLGNPPVGH